MRTAHTYKRIHLLKLIAPAFICVAAVGCFDFMGYDEAVRSERKARAEAHRPYYGTGVVTQVLRSLPDRIDEVEIDFRASPQPLHYTPLLIVRSNAVIGRAEVSRRLGEQWGARILEGTGQVGDLAIGIVHEKEFPKQDSQKVKGKTQ